jgi:hypothetical protein
MIENLVTWLRREHVRWRLARKPLRVATQGAAAALFAVAAFLFLRSSGDINETAASILIAVVFGVVTVYQQRQAQRRQHTVGLITAFQSADQLAAADVWMATRITNHREVGADITEADERHVITILDYYEFLATLALRGLVDTPLLIRLRGGTMARCFQLCRTYIADRRVRAGSEIYFCLELFADAVRATSPLADRTRAPSRATQDPQ